MSSFYLESMEVDNSTLTDSAIENDAQKSADHSGTNFGHVYDVDDDFEPINQIATSRDLSMYTMRYEDSDSSSVEADAEKEIEAFDDENIHKTKEDEENQWGEYQDIAFENSEYISLHDPADLDYDRDFEEIIHNGQHQTAEDSYTTDDGEMYPKDFHMDDIKCDDIDEDITDLSPGIHVNKILTPSISPLNAEKIESIKKAMQLLNFSRRSYTADNFVESVIRARPRLGDELLASET